MEALSPLMVIAFQKDGSQVLFLSYEAGHYKDLHPSEKDKEILKQKGEERAVSSLIYDREN